MKKVEVKSHRVIMGLDPGTNITGYGVIKIVNSEPVFVAFGSIKLAKSGDQYLRLRAIFERVSEIIEEFMPDEVAFESPFYGENIQSMLKLGRAQGVAMSAALVRQIPVSEYAPRKVKQAVTGRGAASKVQVATMLQKILKIDQLPEDLDATDALAVAMCHYYQTMSPLLKNKPQSWSDFIKKNPNRIK